MIEGLKKIIIIPIIMTVLFSGCVQEDDVQYIDPLPATTISEKGQKIVNMAKEDLAKTLSIPVDDIELVRIKEVIWVDSSLGYPEKDMTYTPAEIPGYKILLSYDDKIYEYHSDYERVVTRIETKDEN